MNGLTNIKNFILVQFEPTSKSTVSLEGKMLQIEITTNTEGYLWKLFVAAQNT